MKKIAIGIAGLVVVIGLVAGYLLNNLDSIVKSAVVKYGSAATKAEVSLDGVKISLSSGAGELKGLKVGSPKGFSSPQSFYVGGISITVNGSSVKSDGPVIIDDITIEKPQVAYEVLLSGESNLQALARNAQTYAGSSDSEKSPSSGKPARKVVIKSLTIRDGQVTINQPLLKGRIIQASLPLIHITGIGGTAGTTPGAVAQQILRSVSYTAGQVATLNVAKQLSGLKNTAGGAVGGAATGLQNFSKGLMGK